MSVKQRILMKLIKQLLHLREICHWCEENVDKF